MPSDPDTIGWFIQHGRQIEWACDLRQDGHHGLVDLKPIMDRHGPGFSLTNRRPPCRMPGCLGRVIFSDVSSTWPRPLQTITDIAARWEYSEPRDRELEARGWRIEMGKWIAPGTTKAPPPFRTTGPR